MMILTLLHGQKLIQIPGNYLPRVGESSVTGDFRKAFFLGLTMIGLVLRYRLRSWLTKSRRARAGGTARPARPFRPSSSRPARAATPSSWTTAATYAARHAASVTP